MELKNSRYRYLWKWLRGYKGTLLNVLISSVLVTFLGMNWPLVYRYIINQVFYGGSFDELGFVLIVYLSLFVTEKVLQFIWRLADASMASDFIYRVKSELYQKVFSLKMTSKENYSTGEILDILNNDVKQLYTFLIDEGVFAVTCFVRLIMAITYIWFINSMAAVFIFVLVIVNYFLSKYLKKKFLVYFKTYKKKLEKYNSFLLDMLDGLKEIKLLSAADFARKKVIGQLAELGQLKRKQLFEETNRDICNDSLNVISEMVLYAAATYEVIRGNMLLGDFVSLMIYYEWAKIFFRIFVQLFVGASKNFVSLDRINKLMDTESEPEGGEKVSAGDIEFENVEFSYKKDRKILKGINFKIENHSVVAIVGVSGSGKSTIAGLLLRLYEPERGDIRIGGTSILNADIKDLRTHIGIVHQNAGVMEGTIRNNLLMGKPDANETELWEALKIAHADAFVAKLPQQLDTEINSLENLSTGQSQRVALARILLKDPDIIILDEATSNIDLETEREFLNDAACVFHKKTVIIIAYRANSLEIADKILYLEQGKIKDSGTHEELNVGNPEYKKLISV